MDPTACLANLLDELLEPQPDRARIRELLDGLNEWLSRGGFLPQMDDVTVVRQARRIIDHPE